MLLTLSVPDEPTARAQTGRHPTSVPRLFQPNAAEVATLIYDASPGRAVGLTFVPGQGVPGQGNGSTRLSLSATAEDLLPLVAEIRELSLLRPAASLGRIVRLGDDLGEVLLGPIAEQLGNVSHVILFADGPLADLPFGAIRAPRSLDPQGRFLIETRTLCWIDPALGTGNVVNAPRRLGRKVRPEQLQGPGHLRGGVQPVALAFADAVHRPPARPLGASMSDGGISWRRHAARRNQASTTKALGLPVVPRFGQAAAPSALWESSAGQAVRFLHLAVEARIDPGRPGSSALLLSPARYDEQAVPVTVDQLTSRLALDPESLVVLSGLDTGGHGIGPGPFVEAFGAAGASSVVASLWPVVDESATHVFQAFYGSVADGTHPAAALRQAQLGLLAQPLRFDQGNVREPVEFDASHPYYWAGYRVYRASTAACSGNAASTGAAGLRHDLPR